MNDLSSFYTDRINRFASGEDRFRKKGRSFSAGRLITVVLILVAIWKGIETGHPAWIGLSVILLCFFLFLVRLHGQATQRQKHFSRLKTINEQEKAALNGDFSPFPGGESYTDTTHPFTYDLDIFGKNSVFQLLNRTCCLSAEELLVKKLTGSAADPEKILERQRCIAELAPLVDFRQHFMATGQEVRESSGETRQLSSWIAAPVNQMNRPVIRFLSFFLPAFALSLLLLAITGILPHFSWVLPVLANFLFLGMFLPQINRLHADISRKHRLLEKYSLLLEHISHQAFKDPVLKSLSRDSLHAFSAVKRLTKIISFFDQRINMLVGAVLNGFLLSDLHCIAALDRWRARYKEHMPGWLESIFRIDELNSFASFAHNHPDYCYPRFQETSFVQAEQLGHPLMKSHPCVPNDFNPEDEKVIILTGANMSGKSTFLRSLGVNLVLARAGAPVFASKFSCNLAYVWSSMRVTDSLEEDTSYFYAELKRLAAITTRLREGRKLVILLDEILKGTNSEDKRHGSAGLVEEFLQHDCLCLIATHDLDLGQLEHKYPGRVSNYCFESRLADDQLHFDYKIRRGVAQNKNATFLMRKTGLIK